MKTERFKSKKNIFLLFALLTFVSFVANCFFVPAVYAQGSDNNTPAILGTTPPRNNGLVATDVQNLDAEYQGDGIKLTVDMNNPSDQSSPTTIQTIVAPKNTKAITTMGTCGDYLCDTSNGETNSNCSSDCLYICGDGHCDAEHNETCTNCNEDCGACNACGNGLCQSSHGFAETCATCPSDCGTCCSDGVCSPTDTCVTCPAACGTCCGNGMCDHSETCATCPGDCNCCGNGACEAILSETCVTCSSDCGVCPVVCGSYGCQSGESCSSCAADCGTCPSGGGGTCFLAGTPVTMSDGTTRAIETIKIGDHVLAFDEKTKAFVPDKVTKVLRHISNGYWLVNGYLKVTANHPVFSENQWIQIGKLHKGDYLLNEKGEKELIRSIEKFPGKVRSYNIEVNPLHTYIAGGVVVHNGVGGKPGETF